MKLCTDPRDTYLNDLGYSVLRLPRKEVVPFTVIGRDRGTNERLGVLPSIWHSTVELPLTGGRQPAGNISGRQTSDFDLKVGLDILSNALKVFGAKSPKLDTEFKRARTVQLEFTDVFTEGADPLEIGKYLKAGEFDNDNPYARYFTGGKGLDALLITEVLVAKSISVNAKDDHGASVALEIPEIQGVVGGNVALSKQSTNSESITFVGPEYLTFGFKAWKIARVDGKWSLASLKQNAATAFDSVSVTTEAFKAEPMERGLVDL